MRRLVPRLALALTLAYAISPSAIKACVDGFIEPLRNSCVCSPGGLEQGWSNCNNGAEGDCGLGSYCFSNE
jgi:hypothetical protein